MTRTDLQKGTGPTGELGPNPACLFLSEQVPLVWELVQRMDVPLLVFTKALLPHRTQFPSKHHFLFYAVDSCRRCLQLQNVWALQ